MEALAYLASALIGISLGLVGGGGSILTLPVLVYMFGINPMVSTSYSLFIVGTTSLVGSYVNYRKGLIKVKIAFLFGITSTTTVVITRKLLAPLIPKTLFSLGALTVTESMLTMVLFASLMIAASIGMIRKDKERKPGCLNCNLTENLGKLFLSSIGIGLTTGFLGAGGGFLLIPTLVLFLGIPMREAIGTSLLIIALNSLIGFLGDWGNFLVDWALLLRITSIAITGILIGNGMNKRLKNHELKKGFGWFVLAMGIFIICRELLLA